MAFTINTRTITDTATKSVIMAFGIDSSPAAAASATIYDSSAATYALATLTLSAVTTSSDRFCIGEIVTSDSISMVVQNQSLGTNTMTVYRCTSGTDSTPLGWSGSTLPGTTEAIVGSISGTHTITTSGTVASALVARTIQINGVRWSVNAAESAKLQFGGTSTQDIGYFTGNGVWDYTNHLYPITMGSATGGAAAGDILLSTAAAGAEHDTISMMLEVRKMDGFNTPNYEGNGPLGFANYQPGGMGG
tara:strand:- start:46 stop:789 length:744 start_codon:yes stop_codon:yes gene_type:complete